MSQIAFTMNGEPFDPSPATQWRVRRVRERGLEITYRKGSCTPLFVPVDITPEEFQRLVDFEEGKYRLDPLTDEFQPVEDIPAAYLMVQRAKPMAGEAPPTVVRTGAGDAVEARPRRERELSETGELLRMVVKANARTTRVIAKQYAAVLDAAARVLNAEGANLPARSAYEQQRNAALPPAGEPVAVNDEADASDDGDDYNVVRDVCETVRAVVPTVGAVLGIGATALRNRKGPSKARNDQAPAAEPRARSQARASSPPCEPVDEAPAAPEARPEVPVGLRMMSIKEQLTSEELAFAFAVFQEMTEEEKEDWKRDLADMTDDEVVAMIRAQCHGDDSEEVTP